MARRRNVVAEEPRSIGRVCSWTTRRWRQPHEWQSDAGADRVAWPSKVANVVLCGATSSSISP